MNILIIVTSLYMIPKSTDSGFRVYTASQEMDMSAARRTHHHFLIFLHRIHGTRCLEGSRLRVQFHPYVASFPSIGHTTGAFKPEWLGRWRAVVSVNDDRPVGGGLNVVSLPELNLCLSSPGSRTILEDLNKSDVTLIMEASPEVARADYGRKTE